MFIIAIELMESAWNMQLPSRKTSCTQRFWLFKKLSTSVSVNGGVEVGTRDMGIVTPGGSMKLGVAIACTKYYTEIDVFYVHVHSTPRVTFNRPSLENALGCKEWSLPVIT